MMTLYYFLVRLIAVNNRRRRVVEGLERLY
jgi:hypothetical protein